MHSAENMYVVTSALEEPKVTNLIPNSMYTSLTSKKLCDKQLTVWIFRGVWRQKRYRVARFFQIFTLGVNLFILIKNNSKCNDFVILYYYSDLLGDLYFAFERIQHNKLWLLNLCSFVCERKTYKMQSEIIQ